MRIAVIGHVEHITLGRVERAPAAGEIAHLQAPRSFPGGGGGIAYLQIAKSDAEAHLFTALGNDDAARSLQLPGTVHAARRDEPHTRDVVMITPDGERTIVVVGEPLHPRASDGFRIEGFDAVYFTAQDPALLQQARAGTRVLVVTARRQAALIASGVRADIVVGSAEDPREAWPLSSYPVPPDALVLTEGARGGTVVGAGRFAAPRVERVVGTYGAGDSFAGALTYYAAAGLPVLEACARAALHGAAVLRGIFPLESQLMLPQQQ